MLSVGPNNFLGCLNVMLDSSFVDLVDLLADHEFVKLAECTTLYQLLQATDLYESSIEQDLAISTARLSIVLACNT